MMHQSPRLPELLDDSFACHYLVREGSLMQGEEDLNAVWMQAYRQLHKPNP